MESRALLIALMAGGNALTKLLPVRLLSARTLPPFFVAWLKHVPVPVFAAMLASELLVPGGKPDFSFGNQPLLASLPAFATAFLTRNLFLTVIVGISALAFVRYIG